MVGRRGPGHVGHRGVRHGLLRGSTCLEFSKCRYRSPFGTKLKLYIPTDSYKLYLYLSQLSARCWFEPTRLSTRRKRPSMAAAARAALAEALPRACAVPRRAL